MQLFEGNEHYEADVRKIIVIGGMPRSGTNLVRRIIGSHSSIAIPHAEFTFLARVAHGAPLEAIFANPRLATWKIAFNELSALPPREAYLEALTRYAQSKGKVHVGEKTPLNELHVDLLDAWFPGDELRFVQMVRNPIDVAASRKEQLAKQSPAPAGRLNMSDLASDWKRSVILGLARQYHTPRRHMLVRYEELTQRPEETTDSICHFLDVPFEPDRMLSLTDYKRNSDNSSFTADRIDEKTTDRVYRPPSRREHLEPEEAEVVGEICGELAWALGYRDELYSLAKKSGSAPSSNRRSIVRRLRALARRAVTTS